MIEPQELRIGNYYQGASRGNIEIVTWQTLRDLSEGKLNLLPIPITEEILLKFGFEKDEDIYRNKLKNRLYVDMTNPIAIHFGNYNGILVMFDYIHQLQNIFFILTGEELKFEDIS